MGGADLAERTRTLVAAEAEAAASLKLARERGVVAIYAAIQEIKTSGVGHAILVYGTGGSEGEAYIVTVRTKGSSGPGLHISWGDDGRVIVRQSAELIPNPFSPGHMTLGLTKTMGDTDYVSADQAWFVKILAGWLEEARF
jgi:hypothetical protein